MCGGRVKTYTIIKLQNFYQIAKKLVVVDVKKWYNFCTLKSVCGTTCKGRCTLYKLWRLSVIKVMQGISFDYAPNVVIEVIVMKWPKK